MVWSCLNIKLMVLLLLLSAVCVYVCVCVSSLSIVLWFHSVQWMNIKQPIRSGQFSPLRTTTSVVKWSKKDYLISTKQSTYIKYINWGNWNWRKKIFKYFDIIVIIKIHAKRNIRGRLSQIIRILNFHLYVFLKNFTSSKISPVFLTIGASLSSR